MPIFSLYFVEDEKKKGVEELKEFYFLSQKDSLIVKEEKEKRKLKGMRKDLKEKWKSR